MVEKRPPRKPPTKEPDQQLGTMPTVDLGRAPESNGAMVPYDWVGPIIEAKVGQMKAEFERDFREQLGKIDHLPTKWQLTATVASAIVVAVTLLFGIMAYFGDRQDSAVERSATISGQLEHIEAELDNDHAQHTNDDQPEASNAK